MMWLVILIALAIVAIVAMFFFGGGLYKRIFCATHFVELAGVLQRSKDAACRSVDRPPQLPPVGDPRVNVSSAEVATMYTVTSVEDEFEHYLSVSIAGRYTPHAVGGTLIVYFAKLLGVPLNSLEPGISERNVYHCVFRLSAAAHSELASRLIAVPTIQEFEAQRQQLFTDRDSIEWPPL